MAENLLENYNPLYDVHLRQYFALPHMQKHLRRMGLLDSNGVPVSQNGNVESELYARHHAMMDMMLRNRERVLMQLADLQKKYDAAEKVEIYRRVRSGVTDAEEFRRNHLSRSLSRPRRSATQPVKTSGRRRHSSNSFEDTEVIKRIETTYEQPQTPQANIKNTYDRLSANAFKYQFLHKLDDTTLINYKDSLQKQLQKLKRFRDISFGPHNVARHQTSQPASWFFRRRSLPSLSNSAPQNSLHSPIRSLKAAKDGQEHKVNGSANGTADEHRRRQGKSQSPRRQMQAEQRPRPRRAASPSKRAATTHGGTRLPPIKKPESAPIKPPRIQQRAAPTPEAEEEKPAGFLGKIAGGVAAAAAVVGGTVAAAIGVGDNDEEKTKEESEEMDTTEDQEDEAPKTPSSPRTPEAAPSPAQDQHEEAPPSPLPSPHHAEVESPVPSSHHTEVESPLPSPHHEDVQHKTPSPVDVHVTEASPRQSPTEETMEESSLPPSPRHEEDKPATPESHEREHYDRSSPGSHYHEEEEHKSPSPEQQETLLQEQTSPAPSPHHEDSHMKSPSPVESYQDHHEEHAEHEFPNSEASPVLSKENEERLNSPDSPVRYDQVHDQTSHSFHEDDLRSIEHVNDFSGDTEVENTQHAINKRAASFEEPEVAESEKEFNGVQDQSNGAGAELEHNEEEVEKLTDEHETENQNENISDIESYRSQHEEHQQSFSPDNIERGHFNEDVSVNDNYSTQHESQETPHEHHGEESPVPQHESERSSQNHVNEDISSDTVHHYDDAGPEQNNDVGHESNNESTYQQPHQNEDEGIEAVGHYNNDETELDQHERQSNYAESHGERSLHDEGNAMEQSIYQQNDDHQNEDIVEQHDISQVEAPLSPPDSPKELLTPESPTQKAQDVMVNSFYPGAEHDEPPRLPSPDPHESVEERSHEEHVERDPIQAHEHAFEPGFISSSTHVVEQDENEPHHYNGVTEKENLEPPVSNRSLESFQQHEQDVADDIQHDYDITHEHDAISHHSQEVYNDENQEPENYSVSSPPRNALHPQPSIEITAPSDFGDAQVDEISAPPTPNSPHTTTESHTYEHQVIDHPVHQREVDISDEEANENSSLIANGHEGDREDHDEEDDDDDTGSVVMHKTPDSANYQQQHHHQYQRSDDEQSETGQGHL